MDMKTLMLTGYGWTIVPRPPFELGRLASSGDAVVAHHGGAAPLPQIRLAVVEGRVRVALGPGTRDLEQVLLDWSDGGRDLTQRWSLAHAAGYVFPWPSGTSVSSTRDIADWPVELTFSGCARDEMVYVRGPFHRSGAPSLEQFVAPGMSIAGTAQLAGALGPIDAIELEYEHDAVEWRQWRYLVPLGPEKLVVLTAQAAGAGSDRTTALGREVATQIRPWAR
jgi:hypothetical protein